MIIFSKDSRNHALIIDFNTLSKVFSMILLTLLSVPEIISSVDITVSRPEFQPRETLQAEIRGNFITLTRENVLIFEDNIPRSEPLLSDLTKHENVYYYYAILPSRQGNFSIQIIDASYKSSGRILSDTVLKNFTIRSTGIPTLSVNPGFILADDDISVKVKSLYNSSRITALLELTRKELSKDILEDDEHEFVFPLPLINTSRTSIKIGHYNVPVFFLDYSQPVQPVTKVSVSPFQLSALLTPGLDFQTTLSLTNIGTTNISHVNLSNGFNAILKPRSYQNLEPGETVHFNLTLLSREFRSNITGEVRFSYPDDFVLVPVTFSLDSSPVSTDIKKTSSVSSLSCSDFGTICPKGTSCNGESIASLDGPCCIASCQEKKSDYTSLIIGVVLALIALAVFLFAYFNSKRKQKSLFGKHPSDPTLESESSEISERLRTLPGDRRLSGSLERF